jgi:hypothetical protein
VTALRLAAACALLLLAALPAAGRAATLEAPAHGPVDFGDRVAYRVSGPDCLGARVRARVETGGRTLTGPESRPLPDAVAGDCSGVAEVPPFIALRDAGWSPGDRVEIALASNLGAVPLRYARIEVDQGRPAGGSPEVVAAGDQDTRGNDDAMAMDAGDVVGLGRLNVRKLDSLAFRFCVAGTPNPVLPGAGVVVPERIEPSVVVSVRQDRPDGPPLLRPVDLSHTLQNLSRLATLGFGGCYRLVPVPITGRAMEDAPELFLRVEDAPPGAFTINSIDAGGTGAKVPTRSPADPPGMRTIFDGTSFHGFDQTNCALRDGAATNERKSDDTQFTDCVMRYRRPLRNVVIRLDLRRENFYDNGGVYLGDQEIQLRSVGEYLPGGFFGQFAARWQKLTSWPDWSTMQIVQLGARHVVSVNGRSVTDVISANGPPEPYELSFHTQPQWSYRAGADTGFGSEGDPDVVTPSDWGAFWFRNIRVLECSSEQDLTCRRLADAQRGQVPVPEGAPPAAPPACPRSTTFTLPPGARKIRVRVGGRRHPARVRRGRRATKVRVALADVQGAVRGRRSARAGKRALPRTPTRQGC